MDVLIDNADLLLAAFGVTLKLVVVAGLLSLAWGTVLAAMRVGPIRVLQLAGGVYVTLFRNTPLLIILLLIFFGLPKFGITWGYFWPNVIALTLYTSSFVCEALRAGVNSIPLGQAEAARAIGLTFGQSLRTVILPQSIRVVIPPLGSLLIALVKNSALVLAIGVTELTAQARRLIEDNESRFDLWGVIIGVTVGYLLIALVLSYLVRIAEKRTAFVR